MYSLFPVWKQKEKKLKLPIDDFVIKITRFFATEFFVRRVVYSMKQTKQKL